MDVTLPPKHKRPAGDARTVAPAQPTIGPEHAARLAAYAKALSDPIRVQVIDVLAAHPGELCACELLPLFDVAQSTLSHHLKKLADAGMLEAARQGLFVHYTVRPEPLRELAGWLTETGSARPAARSR
jgi:ArsR family transcriptional regulator